MDGGIFWPQLKEMTMDEVIFWPQLKEWLWMGAFFGRN